MVHGFELAIDMFNYATIEHRAGRKRCGDALLSLVGIFEQKREKIVPVALHSISPIIRPSRLPACTWTTTRSVEALRRASSRGLSDQHYEVISQPKQGGKNYGLYAA